MKKIAVTIGDPGGIGPEIVVRSLYQPEICEYCIPVIIGDLPVIEETVRLLNLYIKIVKIESPEQAEYSPGAINLIDMGILSSFDKSRPTAKNGMASAKYIRRAVEFALSKKVDAIVTAPISKEALKLAGLKWLGHTEMLAELTGTRDYAMMLVGGLLRVILVTIHDSIKNVPGLITREKVLKTINLAKKACDMFSISKPCIAVAGLNPHAGEAGLFGDEEINVIAPAIEEARKQGIKVSGPHPPDTIFHKAYKGEVDIVVCMYHDQGLIPLKMIAFDEGVNITVGLPIIRTSPDHGTAYDIAWKGIANPSSMIEAIKIATRLKI